MRAHQRVGQCAGESKTLRQWPGRSVGRAQPVAAVRKIEVSSPSASKAGIQTVNSVIIPAANVRHLSLKSELLQAVKIKRSSLFAVDDDRRALPLLLNLVCGMAKVKRR